MLSWLVLRARCRSCGAHISARYPLVELLGAGAAWMAFSRHGFALPALLEFAFVAVLVVIALIDLDTWSVYRVMSFPLVALGLVANAVGLGAAGSIVRSAAGAAIAFVALGLFAVGATALLRRTGRIEQDEEAMGFGDVHMLTAIGAWLGAPALLPVLLLASIQGALVGAVLMAIGGRPEGSEGRGAAPGRLRAAAERGPLRAVPGARRDRVALLSPTGGPAGPRPRPDSGDTMRAPLRLLILLDLAAVGAIVAPSSSRSACRSPRAARSTARRWPGWAAAGPSARRCR